VVYTCRPEPCSTILTLRYTLAELLYWIAFLAACWGVSQAFLPPMLAAPIVFLWIAGTVVVLKRGNASKAAVYSALCACCLMALLVLATNVTGGKNPTPMTMRLFMGVLFGLTGSVLVWIVVLLANRVESRICASKPHTRGSDVPFSLVPYNASKSETETAVSQRPSRISSTWLVRAVVYSHLLGVGCAGLTSYWDRHRIFYGVAESIVAAWALLTLFACPAAAVWMALSARLQPRDAIILVALTCLIEATEVIAILPMIQ
jgi:hypothetical protein